MCFTSRYIPLQSSPFALPTARISLPRPFPPSMDDIAHQSIPLHSLPRKRKADSDDPLDSSDIVCSQPPASIHDLSPSPSKLPAPLSVQTNSASLRWPLDDPHSANNSPLSPSPASASSSSSPSPTSPLKPDSPSRTKRPRIDDATPPSSPKSRKKLEPKRVHGISALESLKGDWRWITYPSGETRLAAFWPPELNRDVHTLAELCPMSPTSPAGTPPSPSRIVIPIDPCSPHIPVRNPPINKDTLKELDLEAILRNPQLRASPYLSEIPKAANLVAPIRT
jgi:hypothetical protein